MGAAVFTEGLEPPGCAEWGGRAGGCGLHSPETCMRGGAGLSAAACPPSSAVDALRTVLLRGGSEDVVQRVELEGAWELLSTSTGHEEVVARLSR